jgi:hypothetical protein
MDMAVGDEAVMGGGELVSNCLVARAVVVCVCSSSRAIYFSSLRSIIAIKVEYRSVCRAHVLES